MAPFTRILFTSLCLLLLGGSAYAQGHDRWHQQFRVRFWNPVTSNDWVSLDLADLNGDGQPELLHGDPYWHAGGARSETGRVVVLDGVTGDVLFERLGSQSYARFGFKAKFMEDMDGDGVTDFAVLDQRNFRDYLHFFSGATFQSIGRDLGYPDFVDFVSAGDHTGDGIAEIVAVRNNLAVGPAMELLDGAHGAVLKRRLISDVSVGLARLGDLDGDGLPEIGAYRNSLFGGAENPTEVLRGTNLRALPMFAHAIETTSLLADAGDVDGDGIPDILAGDQYGYHNGIDSSGIAKVVSGADGSVLKTHYGYANDRVGGILGKLGDVDGDGFGDYMVGSRFMSFGLGYGHHAGSVHLISGATHTSMEQFYARSTRLDGARTVVVDPATAIDGPTFAVVDPRRSSFRPMVTRLYLFTYGP